MYSNLKVISSEIDQASYYPGIFPLELLEAALPDLMPGFDVFFKKVNVHNAVLHDMRKQELLRLAMKSTRDPEQMRVFRIIVDITKQLKSKHVDAIADAHLNQLELFSDYSLVSYAQKTVENVERYSGYTEEEYIELLKGDAEYYAKKDLKDEGVSSLDIGQLLIIRSIVPQRLLSAGRSVNVHRIIDDLIFKTNKTSIVQAVYEEDFSKVNNNIAGYFSDLLDKHIADALVSLLTYSDQQLAMFGINVLNDISNYMYNICSEINHDFSIIFDRLTEADLMHLMSKINDTIKKWADYLILTDHKNAAIRAQENAEVKAQENAFSS